MAANRGTILIIVAGLCALLASLCMVFVMRMRSDGVDAMTLVRQAQCRLMLTAACNYIQEASRIGWDVPATADREECFGWVDVRDGYLGPKHAIVSAADREALRSARTTADRDRIVLDYARSGAQRPFFPIGSVARFPMYAWSRPPSAVSIAQPNPIASNAPPMLRNPDPVPFGASPGDSAVPAWLTLQQWKSGNPVPLPGSQNLSWFRLYRDGPATFTITCGSGGTWGYRDWDEIDADSRADLFSNDRGWFEAVLSNESRLWYRVEWTDGIPSGTMPGLTTMKDDSTNEPISLGAFSSGGTILWTQRLQSPPDDDFPRDIRW